MKLALINKFNPWNEVLSVLKYTDKVESDFCSSKRVPKEGEYTDPLGWNHKNFIKSDFSKSDVMIIPGDVHRQTHPLSYGQIPYGYFSRKVALTHTCGWSPWDYLSMIELALISKNDPEKAHNTKLVYMLNSKFYNRFMGVDWTQTEFGDDYESWKPRIEEALSSGYVILTDLEPSQWWLDKVGMKWNDINYHKIDDTIGVGLNWANFRSAKNVEKIADGLLKVYNATGKRLHLKMHNSPQSRYQSKLDPLIEKGILVYSEFKDMDKYDFITRYTTYIVDGTGLGYETAYLNEGNPDFNIYYFDGLEASHIQFGGVDEMKAVPEGTIQDLINGEPSNYSDEIYSKTYPHIKGADVPGIFADNILKVVNHIDSNLI